MSEYSPLATLVAPLPDPLEGLVRPGGDPNAVRRSADSHAAAAKHYADALSMAEAAARSAVTLWSGAAASAFQRHTAQIAAAAKSAENAHRGATTALRNFAEALAEAQRRYDAATDLAARARDAEADARAAAAAEGVDPGQMLGNGPLGAVASPLRDTARAMGRSATTDAASAAAECATRLRSLDGAVRPPDPASSKPTGFWDTFGHTLRTGGSWLGSRGLGTAATAGDLLAASGPALLHGLETVAGAGLIAAGFGGELGGLALDATGVGSVGGVPLGIASAGLVVAGSGLAVDGAKGFGDDVNVLLKARTRGQRSQVTRVRTLPPGYHPTIKGKGAQHVFPKHGKQWFGREVTHTLHERLWNEVLARGMASRKIVPWSAESRATLLHVARVEGKYFGVQFDAKTGEFVTAFVLNQRQLSSVLRKLGKA